MTPPRFVEAADELLRFFDELGRPACLIGGMVDLVVSFDAFPFEVEVVERATRWSVTPEIALRTCSAEDLWRMTSAGYMLASMAALEASR